MQSLLTRFDAANPCWTEKLLLFAGEDVSLLPRLLEEGLLDERDGIYSLAEAGTAAFREACAVFFLEEEPGRASDNPRADVFRTALRLYLDAGHAQRWGIKEYKTREHLPFLRDADDAPLFSLDGGGLCWRYADLPVYRNMAEEFPTVTIDARRTDLVPQERIARWAETQGAAAGTFDVDLLYLCRYDFMQYRDFGGHPSDPLRLINTDRFLFVIAGETLEKNLETVGEFHLWLNYLRRMQIPGYVDRDTQEQDSVSWLIFTTETESQAAALCAALAPFGAALVENANPCEIWTLSLEALEHLDQKRELIWELLPDVAHPAQRALT